MKILTATLMLLLVMGMTVFAKTPETLVLKAGQQKRSKLSGLTVKFVSVTEDSRCPVGTNCVWAGNAKISVRVSKNGHTRTVDLNTNVRDNAVIVEGYSIKLIRLTPEPRSNVRINRNGYQATLEMEKLTS